MTYNIIEIANTHGGNINYIYELLKEFSIFTGEFGIKFQPFKYDEIASSDFAWYDVYKNIFIEKEDWSKLIKMASKSKDVWLDIFDGYGVEILKENIDNIKGIKLQSSVLFNNAVINYLSSLDMGNKIIILNIAAYEISKIKEIIINVEDLLKPREILLEIGFQDYPTELSDSGLSKIEKLKANFKNFIVFADHTNGTTEEAIYLPIIAAMRGADIVEKHVMHSTLPTEYDKFSSLTVQNYKKYVENLTKYEKLLKEPFINDKERLYLKKTIQIPILLENIKKGNLISPNQLTYKRSGKEGLNTEELETIQTNFNILSLDKNEGDTIRNIDFKKAKIGTLIACRLKSSRLKKKAILPIGNTPSIELCIKNALKIENSDITVLATSTEKEDAKLKNYTYDNNVVFYKGDPVDVIQRYLDISEKYNIDVIIRVTGDCPYISSDISDYLLKSHFKEGADYTAPVSFAVGTAMEIFNVTSLKKIKDYFKHAKYSEYMTWYFQNNPEHFKINMVDLPAKWIRNYRLTLDYQEDLDLFNIIEKYFNDNKIEYNIDELFKYLDDNPEVAEINKGMNLIYKTDKKLIKMLNKETKMH